MNIASWNVNNTIKICKHKLTQVTYLFDLKISPQNLNDAIKTCKHNLTWLVTLWPQVLPYSAWGIWCKSGLLSLAVCQFVDSYGKCYILIGSLGKHKYKYTAGCWGRALIRFLVSWRKAWIFCLTVADVLKGARCCLKQKGWSDNMEEDPSAVGKELLGLGSWLHYASTYLDKHIAS